MQPVSFLIQRPRHGWLPFDIRIGEFSISDEASDLGLNAIDQLIDMVSSLRANQESECYFYLEPAAYFLKARPKSDTTIVQVKFLEDFDLDNNQKHKTLFETEVETTELINALIEALKKFGQLEFEETDWPKPEKIDIIKSFD